MVMIWGSLFQMPSGRLIDHWREMDLRLKGFASTHMDLETVFPNFLGKGEINVDHDDYFIQSIIGLRS